MHRCVMIGGIDMSTDKVTYETVIKMHDEYRQYIGLIVSMMDSGKYSILELIDAALAAARRPLAVLAESGVYSCGIGASGDGGD